MDNRPIGLIDSGVGGFSVLQSLQQNFNNESFIYLGDSKNMPYGEKSTETIIKLVNQDIKFLEKKNVKLVVLACNTASSLINFLDSSLPLFSIIEAGCQAVANLKDVLNIGLIATRATVNSGAYNKVLKKYNKDIRFISYGTPTLATVINNNIAELSLLKENIENAINPILRVYPIKYLLLGCTHFPIVSKTISSMYPQINLIDPAKTETKILRTYLEKNKLESKAIPKTEIYISGGNKELNISKSHLNELNIKYSLLEKFE